MSQCLFPLKAKKALCCLCVGIVLLLHLSSCRRQPEETWIGVYSEYCVTVTNAEGETLTIDRTEASGSMQVLEQKYQMMLYSPSICYYKVPYSRSFCFTSDDPEVYCYVGWDDLYRDYTGSEEASIALTLHDDYASAKGQADFDFSLQSLLTDGFLASVHAEDGAYTELADREAPAPSP